MIISRQNALIKEIKSLDDKKNRDKLNLFIVEGLKSVKEAIDCGLIVRDLIFTEDGLSLFGETCLSYEIVSDGVFYYISGEKTPQGVLAVCEKPKCKRFKTDSNVLLLDEVKDPSNVGAVIRTAAACGYEDVYLLNCADPYGAKAVRASMGGLFKVNVHIVQKDALVTQIGKPLVVADMHGNNVFTTHIRGNFCLVVGNEGHGVSREIKELAKYIVKIPMTNDMESLNVAVSASIIMYALNENIKGEK